MRMPRARNRLRSGSIACVTGSGGNVSSHGWRAWRTATLAIGHPWGKACTNYGCFSVLGIGCISASTAIPSWSCSAVEIRTVNHGKVFHMCWTPQRARPNSYRFMKRPITRSCICSVLEKHSVRRTNRLIRVRRLMCLLSIFCVFSFPT
jgi:hypothetical protein